MSVEMQNIIIVIACLSAVSYLVYHILKVRKTKQACSNCPAMKHTQKKS